MTASVWPVDLLDLLAVLPGVVIEMFRMWKEQR
jgi:hypothetical protein